MYQILIFFIYDEFQFNHGPSVALGAFFVCLGLIGVLLRRSMLIWYGANILGLVFAAGVLFVYKSDNHIFFGWYVILMSTFHYMEFLTTALTNPANLSVDSYLLNHSLQYAFAAMASWLEYAIEYWAFGNMKTDNYLQISSFGVIICIVGDCIRKLAMFHAGKNFNHIVQGTKAREHELVTSGIFSVVRHPSYLGWFLFSIGTQLTLFNPLCLIAYAYVTWLFFADRIYVEEYILLQFFGDAYENYQKSVQFTGIPFVKGFKKND